MTDFGEEWWAWPQTDIRSQRLITLMNAIMLSQSLKDQWTFSFCKTFTRKVTSKLRHRNDKLSAFDYLNISYHHIKLYSQTIGYSLCVLGFVISCLLQSSEYFLLVLLIILLSSVSLSTLFFNCNWLLLSLNIANESAQIITWLSMLVHGIIYNLLRINRSLRRLSNISLWCYKLLYCINGFKCYFNGNWFRRYMAFIIKIFRSIRLNSILRSLTKGWVAILALKVLNELLRCQSWYIQNIMKVIFRLSFIVITLSPNVSYELARYQVIYFTVFAWLHTLLQSWTWVFSLRLRPVLTHSLRYLRVSVDIPLILVKILLSGGPIIDKWQFNLIKILLTHELLLVVQSCHKFVVISVKYVVWPFVFRVFLLNCVSLTYRIQLRCLFLFYEVSFEYEFRVGHCKIWSWYRSLWFYKLLLLLLPTITLTLRFILQRVVLQHRAIHLFSYT